MHTIQDILDRLWADYKNINTQVEKIYDLIQNRGDSVVNDHIAFRTFNHPLVCIDVLARNFENFRLSSEGNIHIYREKTRCKTLRTRESPISKDFY